MSSVLFFIAVTALLSVGLAQAQTVRRPIVRGEGNGTDRGGGDPAAMEFAILGEEIAQTLERWERTGTMPTEMGEVRAADFRDALRTVVLPMSPIFLNVDLCGYHPEIAGTRPECAPGRGGRVRREMRQIQVTATQEVGGREIHLDPIRWNAITDPVIRATICFHEYYGTLNPGDRTYLISRALAVRLGEESSDAVFRQELASRIRTLGAAYRPLIVPNYDTLRASLAAVRGSPSFAACRDAPATSGDIPACLGLLNWMREIPGLGPSRSALGRPRISTGSTRVFELEADESEAEYRAWARSLPTVNSEFAFELSERLIADFRQLGARAGGQLLEARDGLRQRIGRLCPGRAPQAVVCMFTATDQWIETELASTTSGHLEEFRNLVEARAQEAETYSSTTR